jgi:Fe-S cluster assembly protein SufD
MLAEKTDIKQQFLEGLTTSSVLPAAEVAKALEDIQHLEFPAGKEEYWKYTRPTKIVNSRFSEVKNPGPIDLAPFLIPGLDAWKVVFVNGYLRPDLSDPDPGNGLVITSRENSPEGRETGLTPQIFTTINAAYATGGLLIKAQPGVQVGKPVHVIHIQTTDDCIAQPRHLFIAEKGSSLKVILTYESTVIGRTFTNAVNEMVVEENARLDISKLQHEQDESLQIATDQVWQHRDSFFSINTITLSGALVRNNLNIMIDGENCESRLFGLYTLNGHQHVDNHTLVDHRKPHSLSNELYKGIIDGNAVGVFNGKVFVRQDAQKTNAFQQNNNVLLSETAIMNTKPELEIYADDVKCSHGCTVGQFDDEAVFYLRSRGIGETSARNLLIFAYASEVLENISIEPLKEYAGKLVAKRFNREDI